MSRPLPVRGAPALPVVDSREEAAARRSPRDESADAPRKPLDGLRGGPLPEPHGVLRAEDGHVSHRGRRVHACLRLLPHHVRSARAPRPGGAGAPRRRRERDGNPAHRGDVRGPRRPRRRRLGALGGRREGAEGGRRRAHGRGPDAGLPGSRGRDRPRRGLRPGRLQPQRRDGSAPLRHRPPEVGVSPLGGSSRRG